MKNRMVRMLMTATILLLLTASFVFSVTAQTLGDADSLKARVSRELALSVLTEEPKGKVIECFDISSNGWFAVGTKSKKIYVYDQDGVFRYGYRFTCDGDYGIAFPKRIWISTLCAEM